MIPSPAEDIVLLREHLYLENIYKNLLYVLNPSKFSELGGFKSTVDYGLGYFNYDIKLGFSVYNSSLVTRLCYKVYDMFEVYFILYVILLAYCILNFVKIENDTVIGYLRNKINLFKSMNKKQYFHSEKTELLDIQEKGEYENSSYDESSTINVTSLQSRKDNNNSEYNHVKL